MTHAGLRCGALVTLLILSMACGGSTPTSPTGRNEPTPIPSATLPPPTFPPPSGPSQIFSFDHELAYPVRDYTKQSRFVLYDNGAFILQYAICNCGGAYRGRYTKANGVITFEWEGWSTAGPWGATATVEGDTLTVRYNVIMVLSDFEDAVYVRVPQ